MVGTVLLHSDGPFKGTISHAKFNLIHWCLLDDLGGFVTLVASNNLSIDL